MDFGDERVETAIWNASLQVYIVKHNYWQFRVLQKLTRKGVDMVPGGNYSHNIIRIILFILVSICIESHVDAFVYTTTVSTCP